MTRHVAYVPQRNSVDWDFPARVIDVVAMGLFRDLRWWQFGGRTQRRRAMEALTRVGMEGFAERQIGQLSGGQQQRVRSEERRVGKEGRSRWWPWDESERRG